jgi:ABC-type uncharacterized transport system fused permease/ATPase subunit
MTVAEQQFEGEFRYVNSRLITNCEEIAFYNGSRREKMIIRDGFERLVELNFFIFSSIKIFFFFFEDQTFKKFNNLSISYGLYR